MKRSEFLKFLGLMRRAGMLSVSEEGTGQAARAGKARLILVASDASANAVHRADGFAHRAQVPMYRLCVSKAELADALGTAGSAMAAVCDAGFARALLEKFPDEMDRI